MLSLAKSSFAAINGLYLCDPGSMTSKGEAKPTSIAKHIEGAARGIFARGNAIVALV